MLWLQGQDALHGVRQPLTHFVRGNRLVGVTALPANGVESEVHRRRGLAYGLTAEAMRVSSHVAGMANDRALTDHEKKLCIAQGRRLARVTMKLSG